MCGQQHGTGRARRIELDDIPVTERLERSRLKPSWAKYVFIRALYNKAEQLDQLTVTYFHSIAIEDFTANCGQHKHCVKPSVVP
ncbi:hypothetical protein J3E69DRAFT_319205 [Trichoderma sp. SZMC 28015]